MSRRITGWWAICKRAGCTERVWRTPSTPKKYCSAECRPSPRTRFSSTHPSVLCSAATGCEDCDDTQDDRGRCVCRCHPGRMYRGRPVKRLPTGYFVAYDPTRRRDVAVHRLLKEWEVGRLLHHDEHVHHRNGKRWDNRLQNLALLSARDHLRMHGARRAARSTGRWAIGQVNELADITALTELYRRQGPVPRA